MAFAQLDPVPDQLSFTVRIDSLLNPDLAEHIWNLAWGAKNAAVVELLNLGLAAQVGGAPPAVVRPAPASPTIKRGPKAAARPPRRAASVPPLREAASPLAAGTTARSFQHEKLPVPVTVPAVQGPEAEAQARTPPVQNDPPPPSNAPSHEPPDADSTSTGVATLFSQFI